MDNQEKYELLFDTTDIEDAQSKLISIFNSLQDQFQALSVETASWTKEGGLAVATLKTMAEDGTLAEHTIRGLTGEALKFKDALSALKQTGGQFTSLGNEFSITGFKHIFDPHDVSVSGGLTPAQKQQYESYLLDVRQHQESEREEQRYQANILRLKQQRYREDQQAAQQDIRQRERIVTEYINQQNRQLKEEERAAKAHQSIVEKRDLELNRIAGQEYASSLKGGIFSEAFGSLAGQFAIGNIVSQGFYSITGAIKDSVSAAMEFECTMGRVAAIGSNINSSTVLNLSSRYGIDANEVAKGAFATATGGVGGNQEDILSNAAKFNVVFGMSLTESVKMISNAIEAFKGEQLSATEVSDEYFKVFKKGNINFEEFASMSGNIGALTSQLGIKFKDVTSTISGMALAGINTSNALKYLQNILNLTLKPSKELQEFFNSAAGGGTGSFEGLIQKSGGLPQAIQVLFDSNKTWKFADFAEVINNWRTATGLVLEYGDGLERTKKLADEFKNSTLTATEVVDKALDNSASQIDKRLNRLKTWGLEVGKTLLDNFGRFYGITGDMSEDFQARLNEISEHAIIKQKDTYTTNLDAQYKATYDMLYKVRGAYAESVKDITNNWNLMQENLKQTGATFREAFESDLRKIEENIRHIESIQKTAQGDINTTTKNWEREQFEHSLEGLGGITKSQRERDEGLRLQTLAKIESQKAVELTGQGLGEEAENHANTARALLEEAHGLFTKAQSDDASGVKEQLKLIKNDLVREEIFKGTIRNQTLHKNLLIDENSIIKDRLALDNDLLEASKDQLNIEKDKQEAIKKDKAGLFTTLSEAEGIKIEQKDTPEQIQNKLNLINKAQTQLSSISGINNLGVGDAVKFNQQLEEKYQAILRIKDAQEGTLEQDKEIHAIDEQKKADKQKYLENLDKEKFKLIDNNRIYLDIINQYKSLSSGTLGLDEEKNIIENDIKNNRSRQTIIGDIRRLAIALQYLPTINQEGLDSAVSLSNSIKNFQILDNDTRKQQAFLSSIGGQNINPNTQTVNSNNNNTIGPITVNINGTGNIYNDIRQSAIEIQRAISRGLVPNLLPK